VTDQARPRAGRRLLYVSLQGARAGSAAGTNVNAICRGLGSRGWQVKMVAPHSGGVSVARSLIGWVPLLRGRRACGPGRQRDLRPVAPPPRCPSFCWHALYASSWCRR
jgi:hypothetical protein